jgi:hypothetical protein
MAHSSRRRLREQQQTSTSSPQEILDDDADMNDMDMNPESLIEQLIDVPNERRQQEGDERFIRSILEIPERETETDECRPAYKCLRGKAYDMLQAMLGLVLIVLKVLWMELIRPAVTNSASQLIETLLQVIPGAESNGKTKEPFLPLVGKDYDGSEAVII